MNIDLEYVRSQFPALAGDWIFFENAGGSQILQPVVQRIRDYLIRTNVQLTASYELSQIATQRVADAAAEMAHYVNAPNPSDVVMYSSTSMLLRILSMGLVQTWSPGDEVIVTDCDHEANIGPWVDLERHGIHIKTWPLNPETFALDINDLKRLMTDRTRLVAVTHASNLLGTINPVREWARVVHDHGAQICIDGVAYAPHRRIDVQHLDVDFYAFSFYKVYGPHYALLYGKRDHLLRLPGINHFFIGPDDVPYKFQPGSVNYELSCGMTAIWNYFHGMACAHGRDDLAGNRPELLDFAFDLMARHEEELSKRLLGFLTSKPRVKIIGASVADRSLRVPTISFVVDGKSSAAITKEVDRHKIAIRHGDMYARRLVDKLGLGPQHGVVRVSMVHYNTLEEVDRLIAVLDPLL